MTERECDAITTYLHAARLDWADKVSPLLLRAWSDVLKVFPVDRARAWAKGFHVQRATSRQGFPPDVGEVVGYFDRCWQAEIKANQEEDTLVQRGGWKQIQENTTDDVGKASLALIHDLLNDRITLAQYEVGLRGLHARWPTLGFDRSADEMARMRA